MFQIQPATASEQSRAQQFAALGFSPVQALLLAATQQAGRHVEPADTRRLLDQGCAHELALRILI